MVSHKKSSGKAKKDRREMSHKVSESLKRYSADLESADGMGEPSLSTGKSPNALRLATPQGSLSTPDWGVPPRSDSPPCVCTPPSVPPPPCGAGQTTTTDSSPSVCASPKAPLLPCNAVVSESCTKVAQNLFDESRTETSNELRTESSNKASPHSEMMRLPQYRIQVIRGNFNQGSLIFGSNAGKQCVANCLSAYSHTEIKPVFQWTPNDLDLILQTGNELYSHLQSSTTLHHDFLLISELPTVLDIGNNTFTFVYSDPVTSLIGGNFTENYSAFNALPIDAALQEALVDSDGAFVCFGGNTMLVGKTQQSYYLFDSHSRSSTGMLHPSGTSICILYSNIENVFEHLNCLAESMGIHALEQVEITSVKVIKTSNQHLCIEYDEADMSTVHSFKDTVQDISGQGSILSANDNDSGAKLILDSEATLQKSMCSEDEDPIMIMTGSRNICPLPILDDDRKVICKKIELKFKNAHLRYSSEINLSGKRYYVHKTEPDGNCFFRSIAYAICYSEESHLVIRSKVVKHALDQKDLLQSILRLNNESVPHYLSRTRMNHNGAWATEFEIIVTAHLLGCDIYTYDGSKWQKFSGSLIDKGNCSMERSILLHHVNDDHYDVILKENSNESSRSSSFKRGLDALQEKRAKAKMAKEKDRERKARKRQKTETHEGPRRENKDYIAGYMSKKYHNDASFKKLQKEKSIHRYQQNERHKIDLKQRNKRKYEEDDQYRLFLKKQSIQKYQKSESHRDYLKQRSKQMYQDDNSHRSEKILRSTLKYKMNESHRKEVKQKSIQKYRENESHRSVVKNRSIHKYQENESHRSVVKKRSIQKYQGNESHRNDVKKRSIQKYRNNESHRSDVKRRSIQKYLYNEPHRSDVKRISIRKYKLNESFRIALKQKYRTNAQYRAALKLWNLKKYRKDPLLRARMRKYKREQYHKNPKFKQNLIHRITVKYANDPSYRKKVNERYKVDEKYKYEKLISMRKKYKEKVSASNHFKHLLKEKTRSRREKCVSLTTLHDLVTRFRNLSAKGPTCICVSCRRTLFETQVLEFKEKAYQKGKDISNDNERVCKSLYSKEGILKQWVCKTCHSKLKRGLTPAEAEVNGLKLSPIPEVLKNINTLEHHLIALHIPFIKVIALPKGGQSAMQGPVVCVPADVSKTSSLPRHDSDDSLLKVKLKKKLTYKGHFEYQCISTKKVSNALKYLKENNPWYSEIECNLKLDHESRQGIAETQSNKDENKDEFNDTDETGTEHSENQGGVQYDTCLQPTDIGQEVLDHHFDDIYNLAPAEGNNPVKLLQEEGNEAKSFPRLFPDGKSTFNEQRETRITLARYFNNRLMNADNRFARDTNYIFFAQYLSELKQVIDKTQISMRKSSNSEEADTNSLKNTTDLKRMLKNNEALRFMQPIRGTPSYWQHAQKDLFAMLRQLGIPTWFCSFSAAEFRWKDIVCAIQEQLEDSRQFEDLDWTEKSRILNSNPVTVARMFDHRFHTFFRELVLSRKAPIGKVMDYFLRVEFQQRGSPHMHCLIWIENAPSLERDGEKAVCEFVDQFVTCSIPSKEIDPELHEIVQSVQQHSKNHSATCRKKGTACRFNFPRPPSLQTFITKESVNEENEESDIESESKSASRPMSKSLAVRLLQLFWNTVNSCSNEVSGISVEDLLHTCGINQDTFEEAFTLISQKRSLVLQRELNETWTNPYNPTLLKAWDANMDIQFVLDPYSCIVYIISYISKAEREMGMILKQTEIEAREGNMSAKQTLKSIGSTYLHHREVGVQEAVYRVCNLRMKECSRKVVFIPTGENPTRLSKPLSQIRKKTDHNSEETEEESMWMTNIVDRYYYRPKLSEFEKMCLGKFCAIFRVLAKSQVPTKANCNIFKLLCNKGYIQRRTRTDMAIIRYFRSCSEKAPELFYQAMLQVYLPHRCVKQLKPEGFDLYQSFYEAGYVCMGKETGLSRVKEIVDRNKSEFVKNEEAIDEAVAVVEELGSVEDAWAQICPETEMERHECLNLREDNESDEAPIIPDLMDEDIKYSNLAFTSETNTERLRMIPVLQTLNDVQRDIFYYIRDWCLQKVGNKDTKPFHMFVTGGAGTGKSQLIKAVEFEAKRLLLKTSSEPDNLTVLLTAFTGTAAFNIDGCTIHHALKLQRGLPFPYVPLTEQVLSPLRAVYQDLKILVIDEISMIYKRLLFYIHERLVQIMRKKEPFGGVSILAVGDFYQLPPVKQKKSERLLSDDGVCVVDMWNNFFSKVELREIMRQKNDIPFAEMLHTVRTRTRDQPLPKSVTSILKECEREAPGDILHVFCTNDEVNKHNLQMVGTFSEDLQEISALDYKKDKTSGKLSILSTPRVTSECDSLPSSLLLAKNARVMLTRNVDVSDGLANGVIGTVVNFKSDNQVIKAIGILFDNAKVGMKNGVIENDKRVVYISRAEEDMRKARIVRHQFPLRLAWACTTHKVQGMTVEAIAVDLKKVFSPGQSYVALSRVTSQSGLYINNAEEKLLDSKIFADAEIAAALATMNNFDLQQNVDIHGEHLTLLNIQSLANNIDNLASDNRFLDSAAICLTETWLRKAVDTDTLQLNGYKHHNVTREESYRRDSLSDLQSAAGGGVSVFVKEDVGINIKRLPIADLEGMILEANNLDVITIYRPQSYPMKLFLQNLKDLLDKVESQKRTILMGDFNEDCTHKKGPLQTMMEGRGYLQYVKHPTTDGLTLIDHVYSRTSFQEEVSVFPTFYSYHNAIIVPI